MKSDFFLIVFLFFLVKCGSNLCEIDCSALCQRFFRMSHASNSMEV